MKMKWMTIVGLLALGLLAGQEARAFYNPSTGRWLSRDPLGEAGFELTGQRPKSNAEIEWERRRAAIEMLAESNLQLAAILKSVPFKAALAKEPIPTEPVDSNLYGFAGNNPASLVDPLGLWKLPYGFGCPASIRGQTCQLFVCKGWVDVKGIFPRHPTELSVCLGWNNLSMSMACLMNSYSGFRQACQQAGVCFVLYW